MEDFSSGVRREASGARKSARSLDRVRFGHFAPDDREGRTGQWRMVAARFQLSEVRPRDSDLGKESGFRL